jgi:hypothetical protein
VKNFFQKVLLSRYGIIFIVIVIVSLSSWLTRPREIHYKYNGIKYQIGNLQSSEPVIIEIKGKYKKKLLQKTQIFEGKIIINGEMCYGGRGTEDIKSTFVFKKMNFGHIESDNFNGLLFISEMLREITIGIFEPENSEGVGGLSYKSGWLISAPCNNRAEAVEIANRLIQKFHKNEVIK